MIRIRRRPGRQATVAACVLAAVALLPGTRPAASAAVPSAAASGTYAALAASAASVLEHAYYTGAGTWNMCVPAICRKKNLDWGADSLTYALYLHWQLTGDANVTPIMSALAATAHQYGPADDQWSDVPVWDAIADVREYQVTGNPAARTKAEAAFAEVDSTGAAGFAAGACPLIDYQSEGGGANHLKTLETDANYIKAALLLYQVTGTTTYLTKAEAKYAAVRTYFLSPTVPLYTVYVFDSGSSCYPLTARFYASANGTMIWSGAELAAATGSKAYLGEAIATARAVTSHLGDAAGVYEDLQAENDVAEPLVEGMYLLATTGHQTFARTWILRAAAAAAADVTAGGTYGRFFGGPAPHAPVTAWQANGGIALMFAAAKLNPGGRPAEPGYWRRARFVADDRALTRTGSPAIRLSFYGRAIAITGTIGEHCCEAGHARVLVDGKETFDRTGIWQDKSSSARKIPASVLFAWRWPVPGQHTITIEPAVYDAKEGGTFFHMTGYYLTGPVRA